MGRKKKKLVKPWCWYCNREFDDDKVLVYHQKAKHFKCHICHKKLYTAPGLAIHCSQVHKETVNHVPNAIAGRDNIEIEIFGMEGIPEEDRIAHERAKSGGSEGDLAQPQPKKLRMDQMGPMGMMFNPAAAVMPGMAPPPMMMPAMPPAVMPGMVPPGPRMAPMPMQPGVVPLPPRPLFPSASQPGPMASRAPPRPPNPTQPSNPNGPRPTFPAYQQQPTQQPPPSELPRLPAVPDRPVSKVTPVGPNCKLMHPEDDISLEEVRSKLEKYRTAKTPPPQAQSQPQIPAQPQFPPTLQQPPGGMPSSSQAPAPQLPGPPLIRPGMPPMQGGPGPRLLPPPHGSIPGNVIRPGMGPPPMNAPPSNPLMQPHPGVMMPMRPGQPPPMQQPPQMGQVRPLL